MSSRELPKRLVSKLPARLQWELKRLWYGRQIKRSAFGAGEPETRVLSEFAKPGSWVVDVGANIGQYSWQLSELVGASGRVIAIEPIPETFALLTANVQRFRHRNVSMLNVALSNEAGIADMHIPRFATGLLNYYQASLAHHASANDTEMYSILKLRFDDLAIAERISLIKVDAEGHDENVLAGMTRTIERHMPYLIVEGPTRRTIDWLAGMGYHPRTLPESPNTIFMPSA